MQTATMNDVDAQTDVTAEIDNETDDLRRDLSEPLITF
jgi:hypothetical protein